jgi:signal transduction histidine kinase
LRTPLAVLRGETEVALERDRASSEYRESMELIKDEAERLSRIVEDLFVLARQPAEGPTVAREPVNLTAVVADCARAAQVLAAQKDLKLNVSGPLPPVSLVGDDEMLRRVLLNLLDNAVKYTPAGGEIKVALETQDGGATIVVSDTGIGIPGADLARIFDRFYRVDKARSRALGGAGLGLAIASWIVAGHGGSLSVSSAVGAGTVFTVKLPLKYRQT